MAARLKCCHAGVMPSLESIRTSCVISMISLFICGRGPTARWTAGDQQKESKNDAARAAENQCLGVKS
jgi:hypothetical protein